MKIKELSHYDRPYEKADESGVESLSDKELLAIILRSGTKNNSALELADKILMYNNNYSLMNLQSLSFEELLSFDGLGKVKCIQIKAVCELAIRLSKTKYPKKPILSSADSASSYLMQSMRHLQHEEFRILNLDSKGRLIKESVIFKGSINQCHISPREIYIDAFYNKAVRLILAHNHPSGDPIPSQADINLTKIIAQIGKNLDIIVWDHIIIGDNTYYSFKEHNDCNL